MLTLHAASQAAGCPHCTALGSAPGDSPAPLQGPAAARQGADHIEATSACGHKAGRRTTPPCVGRAQVGPSTLARATAHLCLSCVRGGTSPRHTAGVRALHRHQVSCIRVHHMLMMQPSVNGGFLQSTLHALLALSTTQALEQHALWRGGRGTGGRQHRSVKTAHTGQVEQQHTCGAVGCIP